MGPTKPFPSPVSSPILHGHRSRYDAHSAYHFISDNDAVNINMIMIRETTTTEMMTDIVSIGKPLTVVSCLAIVVVDICIHC